MKIIITDSNNTLELNDYEISSPLTITDNLGKAENTTLSGDVYVDFLYDKKTISFSKPYPTDEEYIAIRNIYERQFTTGYFPVITIEALGIDRMTAYMTMSERKITNNCLRSDSITITFRESR